MAAAPRPSFAPPASAGPTSSLPAGWIGSRPGACPKVQRHVRLVSEMPVTAAGKPRKFRMCEQMIEELGPRAP